ncbi:hypothetical protein PINS_up018990 [Pythium insidiosum]|nr:hypothetical protein PINS_up018990 [Pythium insidiosum]
MGLSTLDPILPSSILRESEEMVMWQPVVSELTREELHLLSSRISARRRPASVPKATNVPHANGRISKRMNRIPKETKGPRPINPFIMYCQIQKDVFMKSKLRRSAAESRKIMGDMWRKMTDDEKEHYAKLTEVENEKRRREHVFRNARSSRRRMGRG